MAQATKQTEADVTVENHGTIFTFESHTDAGREWIEQNIPEDAQWMGNRLCVEHRYAADIAQGMQNDGLVVK
jgi:hypothetical protein